ncbi:MAG: hypothetical protein ACI81R_001168 [Bradymonadia bacterium]|jgi:hypothetical protein
MIVRASLIAPLVIAALALVPLSHVSAQTADGVEAADPSVIDPSEMSESVIRAQIEQIESLQDYEQRYYQLAFRTWAIHVPGIFLNGQFERHTNMWEDGLVNMSYGLEFTTRIPDKYDLVVSVDWANLRTADGWWLESGDEVAEASWTESNLSLVTGDVAFHWTSNLNRAETLQLYYGLGLGIAVKLGDITKFDVDTALCRTTDSAGVERLGLDREQRNGDDQRLLDGCFDENGDPTIASNRTVQSLPPILPSLSATLGFRGLIRDRVSLGVEAGFKTAYFYGGLELGFFWSSRP